MHRIRPLFLVTFALVLALATTAAGATTAPNANTGVAKTVTPVSAVVTGTVNPHGSDTNYYFQYGPTTAYGSRTATRSAGNGTGGVAVDAALVGLKPNTRYHYRLVAVSTGGTTRGADRTFLTAPPVVPEPSKLALARATISSISNYIDVLAPITARASGTVSLELFGARQVHRWTAKVDSANGRIRTRESIPAAQAALGTGILTIKYPGDADTRPQTVRLRAANVHANLDAQRPTISNGHLLANGTINAAARGIVRVQLEYFSGGKTTTLEKYAPIANGRWGLDYALSPVEQAAINVRLGTVHSYILFTGYLRAKMRGEMQAYEVLGAP